MPSEIDVWDAAQLLIEALGEAAPAAIMAEIRRHLSQGDFEGARAWMH